MKKIIIALAATTAIAAAAPAAAQYGGNTQQRSTQLRAELQAGVQNGTITRAEAVPLREQLRLLAQLEQQYSRGGLTVRERTDLQNRSQRLRQDIRMAVRNGDDRYDRDDRYGDNRDCPPGLAKKNNGCLPPGQVGRDDRDGRWNDQDRFGRNQMIDRNRDGFDDRDLNRDGRIDDREWRAAGGQYGNDDRDDREDRWSNGNRSGTTQWIDRNRDGYDDRDLNRDRRIDDREWRVADGQYGSDDGRYEDRDDRYEAPRRGGIGGLIETVLGGGGGLRVGQRVSGNLGSVPYAYRDQFRDGNGVYYRADSRSIYQIDARTDTVVRIYALNR